LWVSSASIVRLIYVVDLDKFKTAGFPEPGLVDAEIQKSWYFIHAGLTAPNIYPACASLGLAAWFHNCNMFALVEKLALPHRRVPFSNRPTATLVIEQVVLNIAA